MLKRGRSTAARVHGLHENVDGLFDVAYLVLNGWGQKFGEVVKKGKRWHAYNASGNWIGSESTLRAAVTKLERS